MSTPGSAAAANVRVNAREGVLQIQLDRPGKRNALTVGMYSALAEALARADRDPGVRVVLLTGSRDCFTAGNDMADFIQNPPADESSPVLRFLGALVRAEKPLIAAVAGPAVGIGTTMLLHCDLIFAARSARFQLPFVNLGLCPEGGSSRLLPQRLGHPRAAEILLLGEPFDAERALALGLINRVCEDDALLDAAWDSARRIAARPPAAVRLTKQLLKQGDAEALAQTLALEGKHFVERLSSPEAKEALQAFLEKRKPDFSRFT